MFAGFEFMEESFELGFGVGLFDFGDGIIGKLITAFVADIASVTFDPLPVDFVFGNLDVEQAPKIVVFYGLLVLGAPAVALPVKDPAADALAEILGVGEESDFAWFLQGREGFNGGLEFHTVVGGGGCAAEDFAFVGAEFQHGRPAARAGVAVTCAV